MSKMLKRRLGKILKGLKPIKVQPWVYWAIAILILIVLTVWIAYWGIRVSQDWATLQQTPTDATKKKFDASLEIVKAIIGGISAIATVGGGVLVIWNIRLTQTRLITERFSKAVEQLASEKIEVRLGGIYALERIAYDSDRDHWTIMEVLTSFIQKKSILDYELRQKDHADGKKVELMTKDIQAALTVIGRRHKKDPPDKKLDLSYAHLSWANLDGAYLDRAKLNGVKLVGATLNHATLFQSDLSGADLGNAKLLYANIGEADLRTATLSMAQLNQANLAHADLDRAILTEVILTEAILTDTNLTHADLTDATLTKADLKGAKFFGTNLSGADFEDADLSGAKELRVEKLTLAKLCQTKLPEGIALNHNRDCK